MDSDHDLTASNDIRGTTILLQHIQFDAIHEKVVKENQRIHFFNVITIH